MAEEEQRRGSLECDPVGGALALAGSSRLDPDAFLRNGK